MDDEGGLSMEKMGNLDGLFDADTLDHLLPSATDGGMLQPPSLDALPGNLDLAQHMMHRTTLGCSHIVAWSRQGHLASISEDGSTVNIQCLMLDSQTRQWRLSQKTALDVVFEDAKVLLWSPSGIDLAVCDVKGRVSISTMTPANAKHLDEVRSATLDEPDEFGQPVGLFWFNQDRQDRTVSTSSVVNGHAYGMQC